jgi:hypothetical protein
VIPRVLDNVVTDEQQASNAPLELNLPILGMLGSPQCCSCLRRDVQAQAGAVARSLLTVGNINT